MDRRFNSGFLLPLFLYRHKSDKENEMKLRSARLLAACAALAAAGTLAAPLAANAAAVSPPPPHHVHKTHVKKPVIRPIHERGHVVVPVNLTPACRDELIRILGERVVAEFVTIDLIVGPWAIPVEAVLIPDDVLEVAHECFPIGNPPPPYSTLPVTGIHVTGPLPFPLPGSNSPVPPTSPPSECPNPAGCDG
jgi:hypothetical protein